MTYFLAIEGSEMMAKRCYVYIVEERGIMMRRRMFLIISRQVASHRYDIKYVSGEWWVSGKVWW